MKLPIYMDSHATTPTDPHVVEAMLPFFTEQFGNAASRNHPFGWAANKAVESARAAVARLIGGHLRGVVFTSGATEANNLAILGTAAAAKPGRNHIVTVSTEHRAVLDPCRHLERAGFAVTYLDVRSDGLIEVSALRDAIDERTCLISVMAANNEIGVLQPIHEIGRIANERGIVFHCDAAQAAGTIPIDVAQVGADLLSLSAHKMYGPKGVGALHVRRPPPKIELAPLMHGGGHERGLRSGTLNVPAIVGFGRAAEMCRARMATEPASIASLRDRLWDGLRATLEDVRVNGSMEHRLPQNLHVSVGGVPGEELLMAMDDIAVSSGAACTTSSAEPSHVLRALGVNADLARASLRFGLSRFTTEEEVDYVIAKVVNVVRSLRKEGYTA